MAKLLLVDVTADNLDDAIKCVECEELEDYYKYLKCRCFDIANREVGTRRFDIFVDDEGALVENPVVSGIRFADEECTTFEPMLFGNLIFANHDEMGNTTSLSKEDVCIIMANLLVFEGENGIHQVVNMEY